MTFSYFETKLYYSKFIKATFNNLEIFNFFKSNKLIILFLIKCQIIVIDEKIVTEIQNTKSQLYCHFFFTEIKDFLSKQDLDSIEQELIQNDSDIFINFDYNRQIGENESYICELIRNDSIIQFIKYVNQTNLSICDTTIKPSIFETNLFLLKNSSSLIEYAAFYGAIQIFQYLRLNNVKMEPMLWLYAIHGKNADIIHILEESSIHPPFESYQICVNESIKCHHNDIARYFENKEFNGDFINYKCTFKYYNFDQIPDELPSKSIFWYLIFYNYYKLVKIYLKLKRKNIENELIDQVYNKFIFLKLISYNFNDILLIFFLFCFKNTRSS